MSNFEKITESPEALGEFLASLPVANGPWDEEFHRAFCDSCERENCDEGRCPHQDKRYNPLWWLMLGGKEGEVPGLTVRIKAAFPVLWDREYYTVAEKKKETRAPCVCCDNTGKVTIKGVEYPCLRCKGNWREKEVVGETTVYSVAKWVLERIDINQYGMSLTFKQTNSTERFGGSLRVRQADFHDMVSMENISKPVKLYDDYKTAMAEVKRLNAAEREKLEGAGGNG